MIEIHDEAEHLSISFQITSFYQQDVIMCLRR